MISHTRHSTCSYTTMISHTRHSTCSYTTMISHTRHSTCSYTTMISHTRHSTCSYTTMNQLLYRRLQSNYVNSRRSRWLVCVWQIRVPRFAWCLHSDWFVFDRYEFLVLPDVFTLTGLCLTDTSSSSCLMSSLWLVCVWQIRVPRLAWCLHSDWFVFDRYEFLVLPDVFTLTGLCLTDTSSSSCVMSSLWLVCVWQIRVPRLAWCLHSDWFVFDRYEFLVLPDVFTLHTPHLPQPGTDLEQKYGRPSQCQLDHIFVFIIIFIMIKLRIVLSFSLSFTGK